MILSYGEIIDAVRLGEIEITPFSLRCVQPASYDLTLGVGLLAPDGSAIRSDAGTFIGPKQFLLGCTAERIRLGASVVGRIEGRSSVGRTGLVIQNAGFVDPGWDGILTIELFNMSDTWLPLTPGRPIGQICFLRTGRPSELLYGDKRLGSHYQGSDGVVGSHLDVPL